MTERNRDAKGCDINEPETRYLFRDGKRYVTVEHAADQMLAANDLAVRAAVRIIEGYRPNHPELVTAVKALMVRDD